MHENQQEALVVARLVRSSTGVGDPARVVAEIVLASQEEGWAALEAYLEIEPGDPQFLGVAMAQDPVRAAALIKVPGPHVQDHPLLIIASSRAGRLSKRATPEWHRGAEARLSQVLEDHPDFAWVQAERALIRIQLGKIDLARADLGAAQRVLKEPGLQVILESLEEGR